MNSVGIRDGFSSVPFALQTPRRLRRSSCRCVLPSDLAHPLDHFSSVRPSFDGVSHVPIQQPRDVSRDSPCHQPALKPSRTLAGRRLLRRALEDVSLRTCLLYCLAQRRDSTLPVLADHGSLPATELHDFAHDAPPGGFQCPCRWHA